MHRIHFQLLATSQQSRLPMGHGFLALTNGWRQTAPISWTTIATFSSSNDSDAPSIPPLSFPGPTTTNDASSATISERPTLTFGETVQVDMGSGPIVLNANGTTSRITNWDEMSEIEQQVAWKMIPKRNEQRRAKLLLLQQEKEQTLAQQEEEENKKAS